MIRDLPGHWDLEADVIAVGSGDTAVADSCLAPDAFTVAKGYGRFAL